MFSHFRKKSNLIDRRYWKNKILLQYKCKVDLLVILIFLVRYQKSSFSRFPGHVFFLNFNKNVREDFLIIENVRGFSEP